MENKNQVFAFRVTVPGKTDWERIINARSANQAKAEYWRDLKDYWDLPYIAIRARKIGAPHTSIAFIENAKYRGMPDVRCGDRVRVGEACGVIVGHNSSANFDVLFNDDSPRYPGLTLNVHPSEISLESLDANQNA